ncbi:MAG: AMP-binding protein [Actinobacteria bacterium]|nr:AMP-binding protein [Actinomycetota bacterium]
MQAVNEDTPPLGVTRVAAVDPRKPALVAGDVVRSFGDLEARGRRLAHWLRGRGVAPGDRVAVMLPNSIEFFEVAHASSLLRALLVPVNWHLKGNGVAWLLTDSGARAVVSSTRLWSAMDDGSLPDLACDVLLVGDDGPDGYEAAMRAAPDDPIDDGWSTTQCMLYTSATTGRPKGVQRAAGDADPGEQTLLGTARLWGFTPDDVHVLGGPAYHGGPGGWAFITLFMGGTVVVLERFEGRAWLQAVDCHRATTAFLVPAHFIRILEVPAEERAAYDTSSMRLVLHGGAPCPVPVKRKILETFPSAQVWEFYGMSEGAGTRISPDEWRQHPGSVGKPWPGIELKILDADGNELPPGETGHIYLVPPASQRFAYHNDDEKTAAAWRGDAYTVGEMGHVDADGYLYITDRASDMILRGGVNIYPREVEEVLYDHPAVVDCAAFGVPDERYGERLKAMVEVRAPVTVDELLEHCRSRLSTFKCPELVEIVGTLPRDPNGKVMKRRLREQHWDGMANAIRTE